MDAREHEGMKALIAAYVLDAVPPEEINSVRSHLLQCEDCMAEADGYSSVASHLALAVDEQELPDGFADRVMAQVRSERPAVEPATTRRGWSWNLASIFASAAMVLIVAVLGVSLVDTRGDLTREREVTEWLLSADGLRLHGPGVKAAVVPDDDGALFVASGLSDLREDRVYQLWLMRGACDAEDAGPCAVESAGTFETEDGRAIVDLERPLQGYSRAAVTVEPEGGSEAPTTDPIIDSAA